MARNYQYGTSPRKIEPDYYPKRKKVKKQVQKQKVSRNEEEIQRREALKLEKRKHHKNIAMIMGIFLVLLAVSYRNSLITEEFNKIQEKKNELAAIQKTNGQLEVSIEGSLNLSNVEKEAKKQLGMNKLNNKQKVFVTLPKKDYIEPNVEEVKIENSENWFQKIINKLFKN